MSFPKPKPYVFTKIQDRADAKAEKRDAYAEVDARDKKRCRCCGRTGSPYAIDALGRIHRCHIQDASRIGPMTAANLCSLCWICAELETGKQLWFIGTDANADADPPLTFEINEAAVVEVFGTDPLPPHVHIIAASRGAASTA